MRRPRHTLRNERGIALILAVLVLLCLTGLVMAYLSVSALEPQISRNLADASRARYLAEAGIEQGFNVLVNTADGSNSWTGLLAGATGGNPWVAVPGLTNASIGGAANGTYSVTIRNDNGAGDTPITGLTGATSPVMDTSVNNDANLVVIMRATGSVGTITKTVEVVVKRTALPPFPGAVNIPGRQSDTYVNTAGIDIDGRDYGCNLPGSQCDTASNWAVDASNPMKYGMAVQPGTQSNNGNTYEANVEAALNTSAKQNAVKGKSQTSGGYTTGLSTVAPDPSLSPAIMDAFVRLVASHPTTTVLQSTMACPMAFTGSTSGLTNTPTLTNGCGVNTQVNLGTRSDPKLVFFRGDVDTTSAFTGLAINNGIKGAGILVVEDGDLKNYGTLEWDGVVVVTGKYTSAAFMSGSRTTIRGATVAYESQAGESSGYFDFYIHGSISSLSLRSSKQNLDMVQLMRALHSLTNWREI
jgi:Tfp pilus assembly protein PilX